MDDSIFARLGYDPVRIHAHFHGQPAPGGIARFGSPARTVEVKGAPPPDSAAEAPPEAGDAPTDDGPENPPRDGEDQLFRRH